MLFKEDCGMDEGGMQGNVGEGGGGAWGEGGVVGGRLG